MRAARLPAVAVGLSALLASLVLAPIPAATSENTPFPLFFEKKQMGVMRLKKSCIFAAQFIEGENRPEKRRI